MSRSQTDRHALARAALVSLALHLLAAPLFAVVGASHEAGSIHDGANANESTRVAMLSLDRPIVAHRETTYRTKGSGRALGSVQSKPRPAIAISYRRTRLPKHAETPQAATRDVTLVSHARAGVGEASTPTFLAARDPLAHRSKVTSSHRNARAILALTLQTATPESLATYEAPAKATQRDLATQAPATPSEKPSPSPLAPTPAPAIETPLAVAARDGDIPPGGWGQSFAKPLVADESVLAMLRAKYRGLRTIAIEVDASGRALHVVIPENVPDEIRAELARELSALRYVPAECNGLRCPGTLQLVL